MVVACALPLVGAVWWGYRFADALGEGLSHRLLEWGSLVDGGPAPVTLAPDLDAGATTDPGREGPPPGPGRAAPAASSAAPSVSARGPLGLGSPPRAIRVSAGAVLRLANSGVRPSGVPVPAVGRRPAGLLLSGVSGLGIGMQDGDVLTMAGGRPALSQSDVVGLVIAARGQETAAIGGQFWRGGERWDLVVEQPYVREDGKVLRGAVAESATEVEGQSVARGSSEPVGGRNAAGYSEIDRPPARRPARVELDAD